jgi:hypothetical protein
MLEVKKHRSSHGRGGSCVESYNRTTTLFELLLCTCGCLQRGGAGHKPAAGPPQAHMLTPGRQPHAQGLWAHCYGLHERGSIQDIVGSEQGPQPQMDEHAVQLTHRATVCIMLQHQQC